MTEFVLGRPKTVLVTWLVAMAALAALGLGVEERLTQNTFVLPGSETERAYRLLRTEFGQSLLVPVLLEGPAEAIDRQGPRLVVALEQEPGTRVLSPWDRGQAAATLRPRARAAMIVAAVNGPYQEIFDQTADRVRGIVDEAVRPPVAAHITGQPVIGSAIKDETYDSARQAELIAIPVLMIVLLVVFRAPIAALIPGLVGLASVLASSGLIWALTRVTDVDPLAISLASMMSLALGVDYSLLIVTRFREEIGNTTPKRASRRAIRTAGHTVAFAGSALVVAMIVGILVSPGSILVSAAIGVISATALGLLAAFTVIPASLVLVGPNIDRWRLGPGPSDNPRWLAPVRGSLRHPGLVSVSVAIPLLVLSWPAFALETGPPDVGQLPADNQARLDFERVAQVMGPGWAAPFEVLLVAQDGTIIDQDRIGPIERYQRHLADSESVASVIGPGDLKPAAERAREIGPELARSQAGLDRGIRGLGRLSFGLGQAQAGVSRLGAAQEEAASAIDQVQQGSLKGQEAALDLEDGIEKAGEGVGLIEGAIAQMAADGARLQAALEQARAGTSQLVQGLGTVKDTLRFAVSSALGLQAQGLGIQADEVNDLEPRAQAAEEALKEALKELDSMGVGQSDPAYEATRQALVKAYEQIIGTNPDTGADLDPGQGSFSNDLGLVEQRLRESAAQADQLAAITERLGQRLNQIQAGALELRQGLSTLSEQTAQLAPAAERIENALQRLQGGLDQLASGANRLGGGLGSLGHGAQTISGGIRAGKGQVGALFLGLGQARSGSDRLLRRSRRARRQLPDLPSELFDSGYFVLAAVGQAPRDRQDQARLAVNVDSGGEGGRILVVPTTGPNDDATRALHDRLSNSASRLGARIGVDEAVGGTASALAEYHQQTQSRLIWLIISLALVSLVVLIIILRSLALPIVAVALNLLSVGASFGALALLFQGDNPPLGGPGFIDSVSISAIYTVIFGLSLDYQVFLITRMREGWLGGRETDSAIAFGLEKTAGVVTGAAVIMIAVFLAFASTSIAGTKQFGVGLAIAVALDATLIRLLLLPASMRMLGEACWRFPWQRPRRPKQPLPNGPVDDGGFE